MIINQLKNDYDLPFSFLLFFIYMDVYKTFFFF